MKPEPSFQNKMRIFYFARIDIGSDDANTRHVFEVCKQFGSIGHETLLFVPDMKASRKLPGVSIIQVPVLIRNPAVTYFSFHALLFFYLLYYCLSNKPDVVYTRHQTLEWWATWLKVIFKFRYVIEVNGLTLIELKFRQASSWIISVTRFIEWICFRFPDLWVVPTVQIRDFLCQEYCLDPDLFMVIANGANAEIFFPRDPSSCRSQLGLSADAKYLLFIGGFRMWHGILDLIEIMPELLNMNSSIRLLLVGEGELTPDLRARVSALNIEDRVIFCGKRPLEDIPVYINAADICLAPFFDKRSPFTGLSPLKLFEYMACAKPVVVSAIGGLDSYIQNYQIGESVSSMNPMAWVPVISGLIDDLERMKIYGENGRKAVLQEFNWKTISINISNRISNLKTDSG
jgi:glycosyltransferase involved in cell wall biosynthesis